MCQIGPDWSELSVLELEKNAIYYLVCALSIYKCKQIGNKLGQNLYDNKILDEFDYRSNWT